MSQKPVTQRAAAEKVVKDIRRATRKQHSAEEKIRIVLAGLRGEDSIAELCRREGIAQSLYYSWSKEFLEAGKRRLAGDTARAATSRRGEGAARRGGRAEGGRGRSHAGEPAAQKKHDRGWGRPRMRYPAAEKLEIIRLVEQIASAGAPDAGPDRHSARTTFYRWYDRYRDRWARSASRTARPRPGRVWNRIPEPVRERIC